MSDLDSAVLKQIIVGLVAIIDSGGPAEAPDHVCGTPDAMCDGACVDAAHDSEVMSRARQVVREVNTTGDTRNG